MENTIVIVVLYLQILWPAATCGKSSGCKDSTGGSIVSPYYPLGYGRDTTCQWNVTIPNGNAIVLTRNELNIEHYYDDYGWYCTSRITINGKRTTPQSNANCDGTLHQTAPLCTIYYKPTDTACVNLINQFNNTCNNIETIQNGYNDLGFHFQSLNIGGTWPVQKFNYTYTYINCTRNSASTAKPTQTTTNSTTQKTTTAVSHNTTQRFTTSGNTTTRLMNTLSTVKTSFLNQSTATVTTNGYLTRAQRKEDNILKYVLGPAIVIVLAAVVNIGWKCRQYSLERSSNALLNSEIDVVGIPKDGNPNKKVERSSNALLNTENGGVGIPKVGNPKEVVNEIYDTGVYSEAVYAISSKMKSAAPGKAGTEHATDKVENKFYTSAPEVTNKILANEYEMEEVVNEVYGQGGVEDDESRKEEETVNEYEMEEVVNSIYNQSQVH